MKERSHYTLNLGCLLGYPYYPIDSLSCSVSNSNSLTPDSHHSILVIMFLRKLVFEQPFYFNTVPT
jgi:hypothetical protein